MVLTESAQNDNVFSSEPSDDFAGPGVDSANSLTHLSIDLNKLPRCMPIMGPLFGFTNEARIRVITRHIASTSALVQRDLTVDEMTSVAYHTAKAYAIASYGAPIGISGGLWRAYNTRDTWRFPFYKPNPETFNPDKFLGLPPQLARTMWRSLRLTCYSTWSGAVGLLLVATYASSVGAVGERGDPRMQNVVKEIQQKMVGKTPEQVKKASTKYYEERIKNKKAPVDLHGDGDGEGQYGEWNAQQKDVFAQQEQSQTTPPQSQHGASYDMNPHGGRASSRDTDYFDDASPTAGSEPLDSPTSSSSTGSAWDRIRKGQGRPPPSPSSSDGYNRNPAGRPPQPQEPQGEKESAWSRARNANNPSATSVDTSQPRQRQDGSNSFSFSTQEEERQLAKEEAQKEFDARVERERRGEDFDEGDGRGGGRWR